MGRAGVKIVKFPKDLKIYIHPELKNYAASECGKIVNVKTGNLLRPFAAPNSGGKYRGYMAVKLSVNGKPKTYLAHRIIYECISGQTLGVKTVDHINFVKGDNRAENLRSMSASENHKAAVDAGRIRKGVNHSSSKLSENDIIEIRAARGILTQSELAKKYNTNGCTVSRIQTRRSYRG